jgi:hypothetical protein
MKTRRIVGAGIYEARKGLGKKGGGWRLTNALNSRNDLLQK